MSQNYYQLLHVLPDAPSPVIKASYRAMMQKMRNHPDLGGDLSHAQLLNEAVDTLCHPARRAIYDSQLQALAKRLNQEAATRTARDEEPAPQARHGSTRTGGSSDIPGGRPNGYEKHSEKPDTPGNPEPEREAEIVAPTIQLPSYPHCLFCKARLSTVPRTRLHYQADDQCQQCKAPTAALEQQSASTSEELRRIYRHDHQAVVRLWTHWASSTHVDARLQDLSLAGCAIESKTALKGDDMVLLDTEALKAICQVRYCKPVEGDATFSIGLAFKTLEIRARPGTMFSAIA